MEKFYIGLDIGTESVGHCATDENYNVLSYNKRYACGARLFEEAQVATTRRIFRSARHRLKRRRQRINYLQEIFAEEVYKIDPLFFIRLNNSAYLLEDKEEATKNNLFNDEGFDDKQFHAKYKTIFHLRNALIKDEPEDIRLLYLALHHILKYRGNFLFEGQSFSEIKNIRDLLERINLHLAENGYEFEFDLSKTNELDECAQNREHNDTWRKTTVNQLFSVKDKQQKEMINAMFGGKVSVATLFANEQYKEIEINKICFKDSDYQEKSDKLATEINEDDYYLIGLLKNAYDWQVLSKMLSGSNYLSEAMIAVYEKHAKDLKILKRLVKQHYKGYYSRIFRSVSEKNGNNYSNYIGHTKTSGEKKNAKKCKNIDDFYKFLKGILETNKTELETNEDYKYVLNEIENGTFLVKILNMDNGVFPYQLNSVELEKILERAMKKYPFLTKEEGGYTNEYKIKKLLECRIPYYVGPLTEKRNGNAWMIKKKDEYVTPWNIDDVIDHEKTEEAFYRKLTNKCSYLKGEDVLPKNSVIYSKYNVLNQINKLRINEIPISVELKKRIYNELYLTTKRVNEKTIKTWLVKEGIVAIDSAVGKKNEIAMKNIILGGIGEDFTASMGPHITLRNILGKRVEGDVDLEEDIILLSTITKDKKLLEKKIKGKYGADEEVMAHINEIKGLNYNDFGRLSRAFLTEIQGGVDENTGEVWTILNRLYETNENIMEIFNNPKYTFKQAINERNAGELDEKIDYETVKEMYISPSVKRGVWQSMLIVEEYVKVFGREPDKIFIEVTRKEDEDKQIKVSRQKRLIELYNNCKIESQNISELLNDLTQKSDNDLRRDKLYLYYTQLGKCMYTGETIEINEFDKYDIDHIIPQSYVKDDSIDNRVLVKREYNRDKTDNYPLPPEWQAKMRSHWETLQKAGFISEKKLSRLTRNTCFNEDELEGFVARQMVFTNQSAKAVCELLNRKYKKTKIVYSKASNVSEFRRDFDLVKNRDVNDLHHAKDAFLNIVVGNIYDTKFSNVREMFYKRNGEQRRYNLKTLYESNIPNAWIKDGDETLKHVKKVMNDFNCSVTRLSLKKKGEFYNQTIYGGQEALFPRKEKGKLSDMKKYGGYKTLNTSYFMLVESLDKKGKKIRTIENVPVYYDFKYSGNITELTKMCETYLELKEPQILIPVIKNKSLICFNGCYVWLAGITGNQMTFYNANQWYADYETTKYLKLVAKIRDRLKNNEIKADLDDLDEYVLPLPKGSTRQDVLSKAKNVKVYEVIIKQLEKPIYNMSSFINFRNNLISKREVFDSCTLKEQLTVLMNIVDMMKCNAKKSDLTLLELSAHSGTIIESKNITGKNVELIDCSITGLYRSRKYLTRV